MKAYAIFDGGGVKGAALAGCLKAAEQQGIKFVGYGGTSAGSIIALLATVGYTGDEMESILVDDFDFTDLLDDSGKMLNDLKSLSAKCNSRFGILSAAVTHKKLLKRLQDNYGLYSAHKFRGFLLERIRRKLPVFKNTNDITFEDLKRQGLPPLKVVVSDIVGRVPRVFSARGGDELGGSVFDAVRASMSYPLVFEPYRSGETFLVDGGLCSNLPIFLFEAERKTNNIPVMAFDLVSPVRKRPDKMSVRTYVGDMLATALESGGHLLSKTVSGVYYVPVTIPDGFDTLDFDLSKAQRSQLFIRGVADTHSYLSKAVPQWQQAQGSAQLLQALHVEPRLIEPLLKSFVREIEQSTSARNLRTHIMLPTPKQTLIITYQVGMDDDSDLEMEFPFGAGCAGLSWESHEPAWVDLNVARASPAKEWRMTQAQKNLVKTDRQCVYSFPIFDIPPGNDVPKDRVPVKEMGLIGVLSVDSETNIKDTGWIDVHKDFIINVGKIWADVISCVLR